MRDICKLWCSPDSRLGCAPSSGQYGRYSCSGGRYSMMMAMMTRMMMMIYDDDTDDDDTDDDDDT